MDDSLIKRYEYKSPSYGLIDRKNDVDPMYREKCRFVYDENEGIWRSKAEDKEEISLLFSGDLLCQENMLNAYRTENGFDFSPCFHFVRPLLQSVDFAAGNLETPIAHTAPYRGDILTHEGPYYCNAPMEYLEAVVDARFDLLYTANNHTIDAGARGLIETIENIEKFGVMQTGTFAKEGEKFVIVDICGFKVGFVSFAFTYNSMELNLTEEGKNVLLNTYSDEAAKEIYDAMKAKGAEFVVCFPHWGKEYANQTVSVQRDAASAMTRIGYDLIAGCHAHVIQKATVLNGKPVLYSMGNLISHLNAKKSVRDIAALTLLYSLKLKRENGAIVSEIRAIPCKIFSNEADIPYTVVPVADLPLSGRWNDKLSKVAKAVAEQLKTNALPVEKNMTLTPEAKAAFKQAQDALPDKLAALCPKGETKVNTIEAVAAMKQDRGGIYLVFEDRTELVRIEPSLKSAAFVPPKVVDGKPVTAYSNSNNCKNDWTRIFYLPNTVEKIADGTFRDFTVLESIRLFDGLKTIGMGAFENCGAMTGIVFPATLERIDDFAFRGCYNLRSAKIPENVTYIADNAFADCAELVIYCEEGSYADAYAKEQNIEVMYMPLPKKTEIEKETEIEATEPAAKPEVKAPTFAGAPMEITDEAEMNEIRKTAPPVKMGPMNGPDEKHPLPVRAACSILGYPLPEDAVCAHQPSYYIKPEGFDGRLDTIVKLLGRRMPKISQEKLEKAHKAFRRKYQSQECLDRNAVDFTVYFVDWLLFARKRGFTHNCYFDYELYNKEADIRDTFLNEGFRTRVSKACNDKEARAIYLDKALFNKTFAKYVQRDWVDTTTCTFEEFKAFLEKHESFFGKPVRGTGGAGARVIRTDSDTPENLFKICQADDLIVEEIIQQHPDLAKVNESTLNTVRINTLHCADGSVKITLTVARFGRSGNVVDNFHGGGVGAIVDIETGVIITEAINRAHIRKPIHPDSKTVLNGFKYPEWEKVKAAVCDAAAMVPGMRHVGWDVSVTKDGNIEFVEGNGRPNFDVLQSPDQLGRRDRYLPYLPALEALKGIEYEEPAPLVITDAMMQKAKPKSAKKSNKAPKKPASFMTRLKRKIKKTLFGKK